MRLNFLGKYVYTADVRQNTLVLLIVGINRNVRLFSLIFIQIYQKFINSVSIISLHLGG
uniref:LD02307p n=1 Tax=Drosophila melanogaster TaxID=7227 RepID=Q8SXN4_DROME|nr:LD02307p [Drosophila melanogaster]